MQLVVNHLERIYVGRIGESDRVGVEYILHIYDSKRHAIWYNRTHR